MRIMVLFTPASRPAGRLKVLAVPAPRRIGGLCSVTDLGLAP